MKDTRTSISFEYEGKEYELCFTASSLKSMERQGFSFADIDKHAFTAPEELFCGAFIANHKNTPRKLRLEIYEALCGESENGDALTEILYMMISEAIDELNSHSKGNVKWTLNK